MDDEAHDWEDGSDSGVLFVPRPRGFCAGVVRAIVTVRLALRKLGAPICSPDEVADVRVAERAGTPAYLIESVDDIREQWVNGRTRIGVTAGASTPDALVAQVIHGLRKRGHFWVEEHAVVNEDVRFNLPAELGVIQSARHDSRQEGRTS